MRILHIVPTYWPAVRYGGPIYSVHALCRALVGRGHDVHVYTTNVDGAGQSDVPLTQAVYRDGVAVRYFSCGLGRRLYRSPDMGRALVADIAAFDIVHLHSVFLWPTFAAARAAHRQRLPYVLAPRGMLVGDLIARKSRLLKSAWITLVERKTIAGAAAIHATSDLEKAEFGKLGLRSPRVVVVGNGIELPDDNSTSLSGAPAGPYVLNLGRINWKKGLDRLITAMVFVPQASLVIAGNDEENCRPQLESMARGLGLSLRVHFVGQVRGQEKWDLIRSAAVFALPSYSENFGVAALEALACGCPVVLTPQVGLAAAVDRAGAGIVVDGEPEQIGAAIADLLSDPTRRQRMGAAGAKLAATDFSWAQIAAQMERVYEQCREECALRA